MPDWKTLAGARPVPPQSDPAPSGGIWANARRNPVNPPVDDPDFDATDDRGPSGYTYHPPEDDGRSIGVGTLLAGAGSLAALGAGAYLHKNPGTIMDLVRKTANAVQTARMTSMLSGLAPLKSALGNLGAPIVESLERGSTKPIESFMHPQTVKDWWSALKNPAITGQITGTNVSKINLPGRVMGAGDYATQEALKRGGLSAIEAERATLMEPLERNFGKFGKTLDGPLADILIPFKRVPFNQFNEGMKALQPSHPHKRVTAGMGAIGAATGYETADEEYPALPALATAMAGRYGLPLALGAALARFHMADKGGGGIAGSVLPVSEFGIEESLSNPLRPLQPSHSGIVRAYRRVTEGR